MKCLLTFICILMGIRVSAETPLTGFLINQSGQPVSDAYIINQSSGHHSHSSVTGFFRLQHTNAGDTLIITHIGYAQLIEIVADPMPEAAVTLRMTQQAVGLDQVVVSNRTAVIDQVSDVDIEVRPVNSSQEILRKVPGLFIGQHAGGGKAEQIFLRGFDIDHGTDIALSVDGMPVNMVSHAHGQGYSDLHFVIPETIDKVEYGKGPYFADQGNFTTAGYAAFKTKESIANSSMQLEYGRFNTLRMLGMFDLLGRLDGQDAYIASEYLLTDGPVESPQNFNRFNVLGKYTANIGQGHKVGLSASYFTSKWDASGQIPQRAVDMGLITRFGSIDDTEGGQTSRMNVGASYTRALNAYTSFTSRIYYIRYTFELYSNFTFFLDDPVNGDQIRQKEDRDIFGVETDVTREWHTEHLHTVLRGGVGLRYDNVDGNELSHTANRQQTLDRIALGDVDEVNGYAFADAELRIGKFSIRPGVRLDYFQFDYIDALDSLYSSESVSKFIASPKLQLTYHPVKSLQIYVKTGMGFHSNDTRVVTAQNGVSILPYAIGTDVGANWKPVSNLYLNAAFWYLYLQQEFVYVGDAGIVEPSGKTRRLGMDFSARYQPLEWLFFDFDINYAFARAIGEPADADRIPLAPDLTSTGGFTIKMPFGLSAGWQYRYLRRRPANEDNSIVADGYFIADLNVRYDRKRWFIGVVVENMFNTEWNETQFATESRLSFEDQPVEEIHFTPGAPIFAKGFAGIKF